jgi:hypothetical protein
VLRDAITVSAAIQLNTIEIVFVPFVSFVLAPTPSIGALSPLIIHDHPHR